MNDTHYDEGTPPDVIRVLEEARITGDRLRLFYGDKDTDRDWGEENDVTGYISRSTGPVKVPILKATRRSSGGPAILTACIVRIIRCGRGDQYRHPRYHRPYYFVHSCKDDALRAKGLTTEVTADGTVVARFKSQPSAYRWIAFMTGQRMTK
jgi:hypothetical protein